MGSPYCTFTVFVSPLQCLHLWGWSRPRSLPWLPAVVSTPLPHCCTSRCPGCTGSGGRGAYRGATGPSIGAALHAELGARAANSSGTRGRADEVSFVLYRHITLQKRLWPRPRPRQRRESKARGWCTSIGTCGTSSWLNPLTRLHRRGIGLAPGQPPPHAQQQPQPQHEHPRLRPVHLRRSAWLALLLACWPQPPRKTRCGSPRCCRPLGRR